MNSRIQYLTVNTKTILYVDYSELKNPEEIINILDQTAKEIRNKPAESVLILSNFTNISFNKELTAAMKEFVAKNKPYIKKSAVIGIDGLIAIVFKSLVTLTGRKINDFKTKEEALKFLANE